ncbi:MAG: hypothetical protein L0Z62_10570 [Gemmataceae bacterium]|nr:hypothetical protein [Gemmataceae bacterium]
MRLPSTPSRPPGRRGGTLLITLILLTIAVVAAIGILVGLMLVRLLFRGDPQYEFVYRRLEETFGWTAVLAPVGFAFFVLWLILFLRQPHTLRQLLTGLHFPKLLTDLILVWLALALLTWFVIALGLCITAWSGSEMLSGLTLPYQVLLLFGPWAVYFLLIVLTSLAGICVRAPLNLIPLGVFLVLASAYAPLAYVSREMFSWWIILGPFLVIGLVYVALTYERDAHSINAWWASFLGILRCAVYATLAFVFLLPGCQKYDRSETPSRILVMVDVSGSMTARDDEPRPGEPIKNLLTRQDKVINKLLAAYPLAKNGQARSFVEHVLEKSPVVFYRFGGVADQKPQFFTAAGDVWNKEQFSAWLNPDKRKLEPVKPDDPEREAKEKELRETRELYEKLVTATDVGGSALEVVQRASAGGNIQAVILFSDGQRNKGSDDAVRELLLRASNPKRPIHIFTVGVGEYRQPVAIRLLPLRAPTAVRPDDGPFMVRVPVFGDGLQDQKFKVTLWARKAKDSEGKPIPNAKLIQVGEEKEGQFKGAGEHPYDELEYSVDLEKLTGVKHKTDTKKVLEGTWEFVAKIPRNPREVMEEAEHVSKPATSVLVQDRKLRVLLFASGPSRDYQFARTMFAREVDDKRVELSVFLQSAGTEDVNQDVDGSRLLSRFPDQPIDKPADPGSPYTHLKAYDVVISFDADWIKVAQTSPQALDNLEKWVSEEGGALIFIGGPIYTDRLARPGGPGGGEIGKTLAPLFKILPVTLNDSVLLGLEGRKGPDRSRPWPLEFSGNAKSYDFLKLDDDDPEPLSGWNMFFWGQKLPEPGKLPKRGMHSYHPVEKIQPTAEVLATFNDPNAPRIMDGKYGQPYFVSMRAGKGKSFYVGSGELWRLRLYKQAYYERFMLKLTRFVSAGSSSKRFGKFSMSPQYSTGNITIEAEIFDKEGRPLGDEFKPEAIIVRPENFDPKVDRVTPEKLQLTAKKGSKGIFVGTLPVETTGVYTIKIAIPGAEPFSHTFTVIAPDLEMGNLRTNFDHLYQIATEATALLGRLDDATRDEILQALDRPKGAAIDNKNAPRLFFKLSSAGEIPKLLTKVPPEVNSVKGKFEDLWDKGTELGWKLEFHWVMMIAVGAIGLLATAILFFIGRWIVATCILVASLLIVLGFFLTDVIWRPDWIVMPIEMATVLGIVVGLLAMEWLTRKLLKLA